MPHRSAGRRPASRFRIVDDAGIDVKTGEPGELLVRVGQPGRYSVMRGYYNRPEETGEDHQGRLDTYRRCREGRRRWLSLHRRSQEGHGAERRLQYLHQGSRAGPSAKSRCRRCRGCWGARCGIRRGRRGVYRTASRPPLPTPASIVEHVRNLVAGYKKPKYVFIVDALPRNSLGKVLKREFRDQAIDLVENAQTFEKSA